LKEEGEEGPRDGEVASTNGLLVVRVEKELQAVDEEECAAGGVEEESGGGGIWDGWRGFAEGGVEAEDILEAVVWAEDVLGGVEQGEGHGRERSRDQRDKNER